VIRYGDPVAEVIRMADRTGAQAVFVAADVSAYATRRQQRLARECEQRRLALEITAGHAVVPSGDLRPAGAGHYQIFTPYWRAWRVVCGRGGARRLAGGPDRHPGRRRGHAAAGDRGVHAHSGSPRRRRGGRRARRPAITR
jgi:deoxyribodipyrimidine photolyase